ncbi:MAG: hypothetical protein IBX41_00035 [Methanophagales archaeon]|nr:hypothetical protein [Methanophagales archaeon]
MAIDTDLHAGVAIFFKLDINPNIQMEILSKGGFKAATQRIITREIAPGMAIGPSFVPIAETENATIEYNGERYLLRLATSLNKIHKVSEKVSSAFEKSGYPFSEMVRYCEFNFPDQSLEIPDLINKIRSMITVHTAGVLSSIFGVELEPYSFSLSYPETPLTDQWMHVTFTPESNNPENRVILKITKRTPTYDEMLDFLLDIESKIENIKDLFKEKI